MEIQNERLFKVRRIDDLYKLRNTQAFIAKRFKMDINDVGKTTRILDYTSTRKKTYENLKDGELMAAMTDIDSFSYLDKYIIDNFK